MNDNHSDTKAEQTSENKAPTLSGAPDRELELKLKKNPEDADIKTDVGSDESMDASDPISSNQPGSGEPAPSSSFPE